MPPTPPRLAIVSTGTEILQGLYADTNAQFMGAELTAQGYKVAAIAAASDEPESIVQTFRALFGRCDMIVATGGLGPTEDDRMRECASTLWQAPLRLDGRAWEMIQERFRRRAIHIPPSNQRQAFLPEGARPIYNAYGTAPGFILPAGDGRPALACLPGPPAELRPLFQEQIVPYLREAFPVAQLQSVLEVNTAGRSESSLNECLADLFGARSDVDVAWLASQGWVRVRLTLRAGTPVKLAALREEMRALVIGRIGAEDVWGGEGETLAGVVGAALKARGMALALAESCTGGLIAAALTEVPGASDYIDRGYITYSNRAKTELLGVSEETLREHGAVSAETAAAMAAGARERAGVDLALSVTGIAGPAGGTAEKPVGLVWFGLAGPDGVETHKVLFPGSRTLVRQYSVSRGLDLLRRKLAAL